jgi:hypothetical protein
VRTGASYPASGPWAVAIAWLTAALQRVARAGRDRDLAIDTSLGLRPLRQLVEREIDSLAVAVRHPRTPDHVGVEGRESPTVEDGTAPCLLAWVAGQVEGLIGG